MADLVVEDLIVHHQEPDNGPPVLDHLDLAVPAGARVGVVGESGCGKTTLARALIGAVRVTSGDIRLDGDSIARTTTRRRSRTRKVQLIFQHPRASLNPRMTVGETLSEAAWLARRLSASRTPVDAIGLSRRRSRMQAYDSAVRFAERVGIEADMLDRFPHEFSGGQLQRIAIARALALDPDVLIADEPTSSLDVSVQATVLNLLDELQRERGFSLLFISHDLAVVRYMCERVAVMYAGRILEARPAESIVTAPRHPYTSMLINAVSDPTTTGTASAPANEPAAPQWRHRPACPFAPRCPSGPIHLPERRDCLDASPFEPAIRDRNGSACHHPLPAPTSGIGLPPDRDDAVAPRSAP